MIPAGDNYGSVELKTLSELKAEVSQRVPVEARAYDEDCVPIEALLHVVDGQLNELELVKADGTPIKHFPEPHDFKVTVRD